MEQFASQFCQRRSGKNSPEHNVCGPSNHPAPFILPLMPFNFIAVTTDRRAHPLSAFTMMDISLLNEERGGPLGGLFSALIQGHVSQAVGGVAQRHY